MNPNRFLALALFAWLTAAPADEARAQWVEANGYYVGSSGVEVTTDGSSLLASNFYGVFRSTDDGETWTHPIILWDGQKINFASFGSLRFIDVGGGGFFRSTDNGVSWTEFTSVPNMNCLLYYKGNLLDGSLSGGLYKSTDSGAHWNMMTNALDTLSIKTLVANGSDLYAGTIHGVWRSTDGGESWFNPRPSSLELVHDTLYEYDTLPEPVTYMAAVGNNLIYSAGLYGVFYSSDRGVRWNIIPNIPEQLDFIYTTDSEVFVGSDSGLYSSSDSGLTWRFVCNLPHDTSTFSTGVSSFAIIGRTFFCSCDSEIFSSRDSGKSWYLLEGNGVFGVNSMALIGDTLYAGSSEGFYRSKDNGLTWLQVGKKPISIIGVGQSIFIGQIVGGGDSLYYSNDLGATWISVFPSYPIYTTNCFSSIGSNFFIGTQGDGVLRSTDSGKNWTPLKGLSDSIVYSLVANGNDLIAGAYRGIFRSEDGGESWSNISNGLPDSTGSIYWPVASDGAVISTGFEGGGSGIALFLSKDSGLTWNNVTGDNFSGYIAALEVIGSDVFAGLVYSGVQVSTDLGAHWSEQNSGFEIDGSGEPISNFAFSDKYVFALSNSGSLYRRALSEMIPPPSAVAQAPPVSDVLRSYPNPFSQYTEIAFTFASAGYADVSVVNILGAPVAHLFSGELDAGEHSFAWSKPPGLPDGTYECIVRMGGSVERIALSVQR